MYHEVDEHLLWIETRTVSALLHFSVADRRPRLVVYVRPRGWLGRIRGKVATVLTAPHRTGSSGGGRRPARPAKSA